MILLRPQKQQTTVITIFPFHLHSVLLRRRPAPHNNSFSPIAGQLLSANSEFPQDAAARIFQTASTVSIPPAYWRIFAQLDSPGSTNICLLCSLSSRQLESVRQPSASAPLPELIHSNSIRPELWSTFSMVHQALTWLPLLKEAP